MKTHKSLLLAWVICLLTCLVLLTPSAVFAQDTSYEDSSYEQVSPLEDHPTWPIRRPRVASQL